MGKLKHHPTNFIQLIGGACMCDLNTQLKKLHVTFGHALLCPPCLKEQARGFLLLSTAAKLQTNSVLSFSYIWHVANCLVSYSNLSSKFYVHSCSGCPKMDLSLSCSTSFTAISSCSSVICILFCVFTLLIFYFRLNLS